MVSDLLPICTFQFLFTLSITSYITSIASTLLPIIESYCSLDIGYDSSSVYSYNYIVMITLVQPLSIHM